MEKTLKILGKRGRITIPFKIRQKLGFRQNDTSPAILFRYTRGVG